MDYDKKYKDALERAKYYREGITDRKLENGENILDYIFPELKDSEDERIRKGIIKFIKVSKPGWENYSDYSSWIAWLEKQGKETSWKPTKEEMDVLYGLSYITNKLDERKEEAIIQLYQDLKRVFFNGASFENMFHTNTSAEFEKQGGNKHKFIIGDIISNNNIIYRVDNIVKNCIGQDCYFLVDIESENNGTRYLKLIDSKGKTHNSGETTWLCEQVDAKFEKQCEQEPTDKVETKFKVGDWITNSIETVQITGYDIDYGYQVDYNGNLEHRDTDIIEKEYHLWTIQDAKDGDVLYTTCGGKNQMIFIYNEIDIDSVCCYCLYSITDIEYKMYNAVCHIKSDICPATKEQRDMFFQKMHEAGYEWDFEVKELNKIKKKPACSEEEKQLLLKDLCARLPYGVKGRIFAETTNGEFDITGDMIFNDEPFVVVLDEINVGNGEIRVTAIEDDETRDFIDSEQDWGDPYTIETFKAYLRPMSSMTEKEKKEYTSYCFEQPFLQKDKTPNLGSVPMCIDWLNARHFDYRGLIEKGLALEAPEGMYN